MHEGLSTRRAGNDGVNRVMDQKETKSEVKLEEALDNLYNLEEEIEEDPTPFMTYVRLKEALANLPDLEREGEKYEEVDQESPPVRISESFEILETDRKGNIRYKTVVPKALVHEEKFQRKEKNPDLIHLCSIDRIKIYYNTVSEEFWMLVLKPIWIKHKRMMQVDSWIKLQEHDFQTMKLLGILYDRDFNNPLPQTIYVKKKDRKKAKQIMRKFKP